MPKKIEMVGKVFERLTVHSFSGARDPDGNLVWNCLCICGNEVPVSGMSLRNGNTRSCGCLRKENFTTRKHGLSGTKLYGIWEGMLQRCYNPKDGKYRHYGGRGIGICDEWRHDFQAFYDWALQNGYERRLGKNRLTIDRTDNERGYSPSNCRWATYSVQNNNRRPRRAKDIP